MICVTRINGTELWLNPLLFESVERTPDSIVTLTNGHKYVVLQTPEEVAELSARFFRQIGLTASLSGKDD